MNSLKPALNLSLLVAAFTFFQWMLNVIGIFFLKITSFSISALLAPLGLGLALIVGYLVAYKGLRSSGGSLIFVASLTGLLTFILYGPLLASFFSYLGLAAGIVIILSRHQKLGQNVFGPVPSKP